MSDVAIAASGAPGLPKPERLLGDERLAKLAGKGNGRAFAALYERHHQALYRYCRSIVGNDHDAQDALQNAMMRAYDALACHERDLAVKPWLFRIAHNEAVSILRRRRPEQPLDEDALSETPLGEQWLDRGRSLEHTLETRERLATLVADLRSLPERQRGALLMRELSGLSVREIAQALSISEGAAKQTLFEARGSLHELAQGRAMQCEAVRQAISQRDGRVLRSRRIKAHLRACPECETFRTSIAVRQADLRALAPPLAVPAAGAVFGRVLVHGAGHGHRVGQLSSAAGQLGGANATSLGSAAALGGHAAGSLLVKAAIGAAIVASATAGTVKLTAEGGAGAHHRASTDSHAESRAPQAPARVASSSLRGGPARAASSGTFGTPAGASSETAAGPALRTLTGEDAASSHGRRLGSAAAPGRTHSAEAPGHNAHAPVRRGRSQETPGHTRSNDNHVNGRGRNGESHGTQTNNGRRSAAERRSHPSRGANHGERGPAKPAEQGSGEIGQDRQAPAPNGAAPAEGQPSQTPPVQPHGASRQS